MQSALVSIMMPAYNAEKYISQAMESVLGQTYANWQLIVVNDGSSDNTGAIAAKFQDSRIKIVHQSNAGEAVARNTALKHAEGEYLAFLDADDLYLPEHLETCVAYFNKRADHEGVYTDGFYIDANGSRLNPLSHRRRGPFQGDIFEEMVRASDVFGTPLCVVLRRKTVVDHKLDFDREIVIGPDWDFLTRFAENAHFGHLDRKTCLYRVHGSNVSLSTKRQKRLQSLARCREKSTKLERFGFCSPQTRAFVFYDLLITLLADNPEEQARVTNETEFKNLPREEQARLFRLMASKASERGSDRRFIRDWLHASTQLNPADRKSALLDTLFTLHPGLCQALLRLRSSGRSKPANESPFADLA